MVSTRRRSTSTNHAKLLDVLPSDLLGLILSFLRADEMAVAAAACSSLSAQLTAAVQARVIRLGHTLPPLLPGEVVTAALSYTEFCASSQPGVTVPLRCWPRPLVLRMRGCDLPYDDCNGDFVETGRRHHRSFFTRTTGAGILYHTAGRPWSRPATAGFWKVNPSPPPGLACGEGYLTRPCRRCAATAGGRPGGGAGTMVGTSRRRAAPSCLRWASGALTEPTRRHPSATRPPFSSSSRTTMRSTAGKSCRAHQLARRRRCSSEPSRARGSSCAPGL